MIIIHALSSACAAFTAMCKRLEVALSRLTSVLAFFVMLGLAAYLMLRAAVWAFCFAGDVMSGDVHIKIPVSIEVKYDKESDHD